jgi:hypothetical protein
MTTLEYKLIVRQGHSMSYDVHYFQKKIDSHFLFETKPIVREIEEEEAREREGGERERERERNIDREKANACAREE